MKFKKDYLYKLRNGEVFCYYNEIKNSDYPFIMIKANQSTLGSVMYYSFTEEGKFVISTNNENENDIVEEIGKSKDYPEYLI